jgi:hypothetical protein
MARQKKIRKLAFGIEVIPTADLASSFDDYSVEERDDGHGSAGRSSKRVRDKHTPRKQSSKMVDAEALVCFRPFWEVGMRLEETLRANQTVGRPRQNIVPEMFMFDAMSWVYRTYAAVEMEWTDEHTRHRLATAVERAYPDTPEWRLSAKPTTYSKFHTMRENLFPDLDAFEAVMAEFEAEFDKIAAHVGIGNPDIGTDLDIATENVASADQSWFQSRVDRAPDEAFEVDRETGEIIERLTDPDTSRYRNDTKVAGQNLVALSVQTGHPRERMILRTQLRKPGDPSESTIATDMFEEVVKSLPGMQALAYDGAMSDPNTDRVYRMGMNPLSKPSRTSKSLVPQVHAGNQRFKKPDGSEAFHAVDFVDGSPMITFEGADQPHSVALESAEYFDRKWNRDGTCRMYVTWTVPNIPGVPAKYKGWTLDLPMHSSREQINAGKYQCRALRSIPERDPRFATYGIRENIESVFSLLKSTMVEARMRGMNQTRRSLNFGTAQAVSAVQTLLAWTKRTDGDISQWFGNWRPPNTRWWLQAETEQVAA